jgi:hypothetical protein
VNRAELILDLLARLLAGGGSALLIEFDEIECWPAGILAALTEAGLITATSPTVSLTCGGCERACRMPVHVLPGEPARAFIACDKRDDVARVSVPLERLQQWQLSEAALVRVLAAAAADRPVTVAQIEANLAVLPLHSIVSLVDGRLVVNREALSRCLLPAPVDTSGNRFRRTGDHWSVSYQGQTRTLKDRLGLRYLVQLIARPDREFLVADLYYTVNPPDGDAIDTRHAAMSAAELEEQGLAAGDLGNSGDTLSLEDRKRLKQDCERLRERIEDTKERGNESLQAQLEDELDQALEYLAAETGLGGRTRKASSGIERVRKSVSKNIDREIRKLVTVFPALGHHLQQSVTTGTQCCYAPSPRVDWVIEHTK